MRKSPDMRAAVVALIFANLVATLSAQTTSTAPVFDTREAVAAFHDLYHHLGRAYPNFRMKDIGWKSVGEEFLPLAEKVTSEREFGLLCTRLVARLRDSHAQLIAGTAKPPAVEFPNYDPGFACLIDDRDRPVVYFVHPTGPAKRAGVTIGMAIVTLNGRPAGEAMKAWMDRASDTIGYSSDRALRYDAAKFFARQFERGALVKIETEDPAGQKRSFEVPAIAQAGYVPRLPVPIDGIRDDGNVEFKRLGGNVGYVYVRRIRDDLPEALDRALRGLGEVKGLIIDVRGNSGGGFDTRRAVRNFNIEDKDEPDRPRYAGPIALLLDERCISAGEGWASWFVATKRAKTFGSATAGASSRKETYTLTNGLYKVIVPVKAYTGFLDRPIELRGLEPDVPVRCNAKDLADGKDTVLETAKKWLATENVTP
jgi:C-terminal processing protease CtpA/Prc